ncbi:uncharacterized protein [Asterias amurensis]|uniref:uncharacterized protein n=1 Tax=Asterias amurensis TaxID=7602 RepID=UPI003AB8719E
MSLRHLPLAAASLVGTALVGFLIYKLLKPQQRSRMDYSEDAVVVETIDASETSRFSYLSEMDAEVQAVPFDDDDDQKASTHQESLPPTTKPKVTDATSQALQQDQVPHTPSPIQETAAQPLLKPIAQKPPEEDDEHYDVLLLYSEHDQSAAKQFLGVAKKAKWKVATSNDFLGNRPKIKTFEDVYQNCSFTALLLTSKFFADVWCDSRYQGALTRAIEDPAKKYTVIPIICQDQGLDMPVMLSSYNGVNQNSPFFADRLKKIIKVEKRLEREKQTEMGTNCFVHS